MVVWCSWSNVALPKSATRMLVFFTDFSSQLCQGKAAVRAARGQPGRTGPPSHQYLVLVVESFKLGIHKQDVLWLQVRVGQLVLMENCGGGREQTEPGSLPGSCQGPGQALKGGQGSFPFKIFSSSACLSPKLQR